MMNVTMKAAPRETEMVRWRYTIGFILIAGVFIMAIIPSALGQGAKVHRQTALLTVQPRLAVRGNEIHATVQPFDDRTLLRVCLISPSGDVLSQEQLKGNAPVLNVPLTIPEGIGGSLRVILEARRGGYWMPVASEEIHALPNFWKDLCGMEARIEKVEQRAASGDTTLLQAAWAVLAFSEDLKERVNLSKVGQAWDVQRRLAALRSKTEALESGKDPYDNATGYQLRGYRSELDGGIQLYSTYVPKGYGVDPEQKWPLVVMLHGAFSNHHLALRRVMGLTNQRGESDAEAKRYMPSLADVPYIVVAPNGFETGWYRGYAEEDAWRVLDEVQRLFSIDPNRIYLTGLSMGGFGTAKLGLTHPGRFAAIAPVCGFFDEFLLDPNGTTPDYVKRFIRAKMPIEFAVNAFQLPVKLIHGKIDPVVPVRNSVDLGKKLNELGYRAELEIYPNVEHDAWVGAYENARIFEWFSQFERNPFPSKVVYQTGYTEGGESYWVRIEETEQLRRIARIEAEISGNGVSVKVDNIQRFSLAVPDALIAAENITRVTVDGQAIYEGTLGSTIRFQKENGEWKWMRGEAPHRLLPHTEGLYGALYGKHVFVYGDAGTPEENREAQRLATLQSIPDPWLDALFPVLPESALSPEVMKNNHIVIYSTLKGSTFLQNYTTSLPFQVKGDRIEMGGRALEANQALVFIYPNPANPERYVLAIVSMTVEGLQSVKSLNATPESLYENAPGDFVIIGPDGKFVWGGLFDKEWKIEEIGEF